MLVLHALTAGLGDCLVLEFQDRSIGIVDCGRQGGAQPASILRAYLQENWPGENQPRLRFLVVTHPHADHDSGIMDLLIGFDRPLDQFFYLDAYPEVSAGTPEPEWARYLDYARAQHQRGFLLQEPRSLRAGQRIAIEQPDVELLVLSPTDRLVHEALVNRTSRTLNRASIVIQATYHEHTVLLGADAPNDIWEQIITDPLFRPPNVFKMPHHGSGIEGFPLRLLSALEQPLIALFSCPSGDPKHPGEDLLVELQGRPSGLVRCTGFARSCRWEPSAPLTVGRELPIQRRVTLQTLPRIHKGNDTVLCCGNLRVVLEPGTGPQVRVEGLRQTRGCDPITCS